MDRQQARRVRLFLVLGSGSVVLVVSLVYVAYRFADGPVFIQGIALPMLAFGGGLFGAGTADRATDGRHRPLRIGLALAGAFVGAICYPVLSTVASGAIYRNDVLPFIDGYISWGLALAVVAVASIEVLVWESRGRPR